jgi:hypothetical protein
MRGASLRSGRPLWLVTLADLSLLLVGFFVFLQATREERRPAIAAGIREAFGGAAAAPIPVEANRIAFAAGSAALPDMAPVRAWLAQAAADPRTRVTVTGHDPADLTLAAARADAVAGALGLPPARIRRAAAVRPGATHADLSISFDP